MSNASAASPVVLTPSGRAWLQERLDRASARRSQIEDELRQERSPELVAEHRELQDQITELTRILLDAVFPADIADDPAIVEVGDEVELEFPDGSRESFLVVHPAEAGMDERRTSAEAPLARAILGSRPGDRVTVRSPAGVYACTVMRRARIG